MSAQRRETDREAAESVERLWQVYADEIGIPRAEPADSSESLRQPREDPTPRRRPLPTIARSVGRLMAGAAVVGAAVVVVVLIAGIAVWLRGSSLPDQTDRRPPTLAAAPAGETGRLALPPAPAPRAGDGARASALPVPTPSDVADSLRRQPEPAPAPSPRAVAVPETTHVSEPPPAATKPERAVAVHRIHFDFGSDRLTDESMQILDTIVHAMKADRAWRASIEGHTDALGSPDYNQALSERRAQAAHAYLQSAGIAPGRLSVIGFGASRPVAPHDARGHASNRRVELHRR
jgi:outer membrane protein OmpA-like peptidoglycan-associated protein